MFLPERNWLNVRKVGFESFFISPTCFDELFYIVFVDFGSLMTQLSELVIQGDELVFSFFHSGVLNVLISGFRVQSEQHLFQLVERNRFGDLVENFNFWKYLISDSVFYRQSYALYWVFDVDETSCLSACAVNCYGMVMSNLCTESVQYSTIIAVNIDSVDENRIHFSFLSADSPNNSLVKFSDFEVEVFLEIEECHIIKTLCHMVNWTWVVRVNDFYRLAWTLLNMITVEFCFAVTFGDIWALHSSVPVDSHRS